MVIRSVARFGAMAVCAFLFSAPAARAADITVNSVGDTVDAAAGDGSCGSGLPNSCTVRAAIQEANANTDPSNRILFSVAGPTTLLSALDAVTKPLEIDGGTGGYTIDGNTLVGLLRIPSGAATGAYTFRKLTLSGGRTTAGTGGGAIFFAPTALASLTLTDVEITGSTATAGPGGGLAAELLANGASVTLLRVNINNNTASGNGGGLWLRLGGTGSMSLDDAIVDGNTAGAGGNGNGGGIYVARGRLSVGNTTISNNTATGTGQGGGVYLHNDGTIGGSIRLDNSTVSTNTNDGIAVGSGNPAASWATFNTITGNTGAGIRAAVPATSFPGNVSNPFTSNIVGGTTPCTASFSHSDATNSGYNLSHGASCGFNQTTDKSAANDGALLLGALSENPVPPQTRALQAGSLAIDAGNPAWDTGADQRGADTQDGGADGTPGNSTPVRDIGAYEFGGFGLVQFGFTVGTNFDAPEDITPAALSLKRYGIGTAATSAPTVAFSTAAFASTTEGDCSSAGNDYTELAPNPTEFSFTGTAGLNQFDQTASIPICKDTAVEANEGFNIALAKPVNEPVGYDLGPKAAGTVTIVDRENGEFRFDNTVTPHEANEGNTGSSGSVTLTILRTAGTGTYGAVRVTYSTTTTCSPACTAEANDFTAVIGGTVDFADGETSKTVTVNFVGDTAYEDDGGGGETFRVKLDAVDCLNLQVGQSCDARLVGMASDANRFALVEITNDDTAQPGQFQFSATGYTGLEAGGSVTITVRRVGGTDGDVSVLCGTADGTGSGAATESADYLAPANTPDPLEPCLLSWLDGDPADKTFSVPLIDDGNTESNKTFSATLAAPSGGMGGAGGVAPTIGTPSVPVTLVSDEQPQFVFSSTTQTVDEGSPAQLTLQWEGFTGGDVTVPYYTVDGTATSPIDYTGIPQGAPTVRTLTSADPTSLALSNIPTFADGPEGNETFIVQLGAPGNGGQLGADDPLTPGVTEGPATTVTIRDPASVVFTAASFTRANEANNGTISLTVRRRGGDTSQSMDVDFTISQNCAAAPCATESVDYTRPGGFTGTAHWDGNVTTDQTISITVIGDTAIEGDEGIKVTLSNARIGTAPADIGTPGEATAVIPDDDYRFEVVETSPVVIGEAGGSAVVTVRRFGSTIGAASVNYATADGTAAQPGDYTQTTGTLNWGAGVGGTQTFSVPVASDSIDEGNESLSVALSGPSNTNSGEATTITGSPLTVQITDDDTAGVTVTQSGGTTAVSEAGATDTYTLVLTSEPTADVTVTVTGDADASGSPGSLTFTAANWNVAQTVTVTATNDAIAEGAHSGVLTHAATSADAGYNGIAIAAVTASITDDDTAGVTVTQSGGSTAVTEGGATDTYTLVLTSQPTASVTITVTPNAQVTRAPASVTFTTANWNVAQTVTVGAVNDASVEGTHSGAITHSAASTDPVYNGRTVAGVAVTITDNDTAGVNAVQSGGSTAVTEGGATDTLTITLTSQPAANVTITPSAGTQLAVTPATLTFTPANWNVAQTVTVRAVDDAQVEGTHTASLGGSVSSTDAAYNGSLAAITVTITDNDQVTAGEGAPGVVVTPSGNVASGGGGGGAFSWGGLLGLLALAGLRRRAALGAALALASTVTLAQTPAGQAPRFSYDSVDLRYLSVSVDEPSVDAAGFALAGSWEVGKTFYVLAGYSAIETDNFVLQGVIGSTETTTLALGAGLHYPAGKAMEFTAALNLLSASADGQGGFQGSADDTGFGLEGGLRGSLSPTMEWSAALNWVSVFDDDDTALTGQTQWRAGRNWSVLAGAGFGSNSRQVNIGARYNF